MRTLDKWYHYGIPDAEYFSMWKHFMFLLFNGRIISRGALGCPGRD